MRLEDSSEENLIEPLISRDTSMDTRQESWHSKYAALFTKKNIYSSYVLSLFLITYLLNQLDRYMLAIVTKPLAQVIH